jgi:hypothetical protein
MSRCLHCFRMERKLEDLRGTTIRPCTGNGEEDFVSPFFSSDAELSLFRNMQRWVQNQGVGGRKKGRALATQEQQQTDRQTDEMRLVAKGRGGAPSSRTYQ